VLFVDRAGAGGEQRALDGLLRPFAIEYALVDGQGASPELLARVRSSRFLLNVMGYLDDPAVLGEARRRVFLDIDPGFPQMWFELRLADVLAGHDAYVTVAENVGRDDCRIPTCGLEWLTTRQPVVLDHWPRTAVDGRTFATIGAWRGLFGPVEYEGVTYGPRVHEFRKFLDLPSRTNWEFIAALDIDANEERDLERLNANGWTLVDPFDATGSPDRYRRFVQAAGAEFGVAKSMYVETQGGWFSDRTACFLASGKPVLIQDTGLQQLYPVGEGLLTFRRLEEAEEGVVSIVDRYSEHARAARAVAEKHFDSDRVLARLVDLLQ
jgi:hypothetical protein